MCMWYNYLLAWGLGLLTSWLAVGAFLLTRHCVREYRKNKELDELLMKSSG